MMEKRTAIVDKEGFLQVRVRKALRLQLCPFKDRSCGDWCPLFEYSDEDSVYVSCGGAGAVEYKLEG